MTYDVLIKPKKTNGIKQHRQLLIPLAQVLLDFEDFNEELKTELNPFTTKKLLPLWEKELGIPDGCIGIATTLAGRRANVLFKLFAIGIESPQDIIDLAAQLNLKVNVRTSISRCTYPVRYPVPFFSLAQLPFVFFIEYIELTNPFPYPQKYPVPYYKDENIEAFECLISKSMPPNYFVVFEKLVPPTPLVILPNILTMNGNEILTINGNEILTFN